MSHLPPPPPAGWYPDQLGNQRYWDGSRWLELPAPPVGAQPGQQPAMTPHATTTKRRWPIVVALICLVVGLAVVMGAQVMRSVEQEQERQAVEAREQLVEQIRVEGEQNEAEAAAEAERSATEAASAAQRERRTAAITEVESAARDLAADHIARGLMSGTVLTAHCTPIDGYDIEDLNQSSAVLNCFVGVEDLGEGRYRGQDYTATVDWESGRFSVSLGG